ncbi:hypothetical protein [Malaciobacter marinus]|jgi:hypothetical protein|uniref:hypothetical protein n=1 Tax=Malaciobacter marinus TaxID=505249 RepID=UPI0009A8C74D|nr:hypothetical protein [Malaciobacter marinus]SKB73094.1 hypothetical protein SAMN06295997_13618 [Malaciobacter marinus]
MTLYAKYSKNGFFSLENMLEDLNINSKLINEIIIRYNTSSLLKEFIEKIKNTDENEDIKNIILEFFLIADKMKPITCNKKTLSKLTGLSERQIDERRRARQIPFIQLTGSSGTGRKIILYDPYEIKNAIDNNRVKTIS